MNHTQNLLYNLEKVAESDFTINGYAKQINMPPSQLKEALRELLEAIDESLKGDHTKLAAIRDYHAVHARYAAECRDLRQNR